MAAGVADAADLLEVGLGTGAEPIHERLECVRMGAILCLELAQLRLGASHDELGERRRVRPQACAKWLERSGQRGSLGDRVPGVGRRHTSSVAPYSTATAQIPTTVSPSERAAWA